MKLTTAPTDAQLYRVPERFGLAAIMSLMTLMSLLFGLLRSLDAPPFFFLFFGVMTLAVSIAQMFFGQVPRAVSIVVGAAFLPLFTLVIAMIYPPREGIGMLIIGTPCIAISGGILGYLTGTIAAGVFLVLDQLAARAERRRLASEVIAAEIVDGKQRISAEQGAGDEHGKENSDAGW